MGSIKVNGAWSTIKLPYARISGSWRPCKQIYIKVGGTWKIAFDLNLEEPFDGTGSLSGQLTPGYVPWEILNGTWTKSSGNVAGSITGAVAAIETGVTDGEWEIDTEVTTDGGPGVGFWISDQSNWWGVRFYTEQYSFTIPGNAFYYNHSVYQTYTTRPAGSTNPSSFASCPYVGNYAKIINSNNYVNNNVGNRQCSCSTNANSSCFVNASVFNNTCTTSCSPSPYPPCTNNNKGVQFARNCGAACATCTTGPCPACPSSTSGANFVAPCPAPGTISFVTSGYTGCGCGCSLTANYNTANNAISYNCPATTDTNTNFLTFACPTNNSLPTCSTNTNNSLATSLTYSCTTTPSDTNYYAGTNPATPSTGIYKRGQLVQSSGGVVNIVSNQDFGDVGNLYAKTYGNTVDFKQYSGAGRTGNVSNVVTYAAPAGSSSGRTKHGIIITAVPYTQVYNIGRFKATV